MGHYGLTKPSAWHFAIHSNPLWLHSIFYPAKATSWFSNVFSLQNISNPRPIVAAVLATVWGLRLTYNFWRKGGYTDHGEDYRWVEMRARMPAWAFQIMNITFIATQQHALLFALTWPLWICYKVGFQGWNWIDVVATVGFAGLLALETVADQQQWVFQNKKYAVRKGELKLAPNDPDAADIKRGFLTRGLFANSRHPNFLAEQSMWWMVYLYSVAATGSWINWSLGGTLALTMLFQVRLTRETSNFSRDQPWLQSTFPSTDIPHTRFINSVFLVSSHGPSTKRWLGLRLNKKHLYIESASFCRCSTTCSCGFSG